MTALARNLVAPARGDGESRLGGIEAESRGGVQWSGSGGRIRIGRVERIAIQGEARSAGHGGCGSEPVAVVNQEAGTDAKAIVERIDIRGNPGGGQVQPGVGVESVGREIGGIAKHVAGGADIQVAADIRCELHTRAQGRNAAADGNARERTGSDGGGRMDDDAAGDPTSDSAFSANRLDEVPDACAMRAAGAVSRPIAMDECSVLHRASLLNYSFDADISRT